MNTKIGMFMVLLLVSGVFAVSVVLAERGNPGNMGLASKRGMGVTALTNLGEVAESDMVNASNISVGEINNEEASAVLKEVETGGLPESKRIGFTNIWKGHGWIDDGKEGHLITSLWAVQRFALVNSTTDSIGESPISRAFGRLYVSDAGIYKLVRYKENNSEDNVNFYVIPIKKTVSISNAKSYAIGKLSLTKENVFSGLTIWKGSLVFDSGNLSREWDMELGTTVKKISPRKIAVKNARDTRKKAGVKNSANLKGRQKAEAGRNIRARVRESFWRRIQFWRRD